MKKVLATLLAASVALSLAAGVLAAEPVAATGKNLALKDGQGFDPANWRIRNTTKSDAVKFEDGKIIFNSAGDKDQAGPQGIYDAFTMSFDFSMEPGGTWAGLTFGNARPGDFFAETDQVLLLFMNGRMMAMQAVTSAGGEKYYTPADVGSDWAPAGHAIYELYEEDKFLNVKVTFDADRTLKLYYKVNTAPDSDLDIVRYQVNNLPEGPGYINFVATKDGSNPAAVGSLYTIDNLKIFNTADADITQAIPDVAPAVETSTIPGLAPAAADITKDSLKVTYAKQTGAIDYLINVFSGTTFVKSVRAGDADSAVISGLNAETEYTLQVIPLGDTLVTMGYSTALKATTLGETAGGSSSTPGTDSSKNDNPKTGALPAGALAVLMLSAAGAAFAGRKKRCR